LNPAIQKLPALPSSSTHLQEQLWAVKSRPPPPKQPERGSFARSTRACGLWEQLRVGGCGTAAACSSWCAVAGEPCAEALAPAAAKDSCSARNSWPVKQMHVYHWQVPAATMHAVSCDDASTCTGAAHGSINTFDCTYDSKASLTALNPVLLTFTMLLGCAIGNTT
jgi:hypothetical protein